MSYQENHLRSCDYCNRNIVVKPTIRIKAASNYYENKKPTVHIKSSTEYNKYKKLGELGSIIRGTSYPNMKPILQTKGASNENNFKRPGPIEKEVKLKELGKMVGGR